MNAVEIVPITPDHIASFRRTLDFVARERRYLAFLEAPPLESTREYVLSLIKRGYPQFVAVSDGEVCGWCDVAPKGRPIYAHSGVLGMGLLPRFRGQRTGERLIVRTLDAARELGLKRVELTVREDNSNAIALYTKVGFEIEGLQRRAFQINGNFQNLICMAVLF